jgi:hypothetical protein
MSIWPADTLAEIREAGWRVAVHNDYMQNGKLMTFWLFTLPKVSIFVRGEAESDVEAIAKCREQIKEFGF